MMLANHAESPNGLLYVSGGAWDSINVTQPPPASAPDGTVAAIQGFLVIRLLFHATECGTDYPFRVTIIDEDGAEIGGIEGEIRADAQTGAPPTWTQPANIIVSLTGLPLPRFGEYRVSLQVNREHKGELPFRTVKAY